MASTWQYTYPQQQQQQQHAYLLQLQAQQQQQQQQPQYYLYDTSVVDADQQQHPAYDASYDQSAASTVYVIQPQQPDLYTGVSTQAPSQSQYPYVSQSPTQPDSPLEAAELDYSALTQEDQQQHATFHHSQQPPTQQAPLPPQAPAPAPAPAPPHDQSPTLSYSLSPHQYDRRDSQQYYPQPDQALFVPQQQVQLPQPSTSTTATDIPQAQIQLPYQEPQQYYYAEPAATSYRSPVSSPTYAPHPVEAPAPAVYFSPEQQQASTSSSSWSITYRKQEILSPRQLDDDSPPALEESYPVGHPVVVSSSSPHHSQPRPWPAVRSHSLDHLHTHVHYQQPAIAAPVPIPAQHSPTQPPPTSVPQPPPPAALIPALHVQHAPPPSPTRTQTQTLPAGQEQSRTQQFQQVPQQPPLVQSPTSSKAEPDADGEIVNNPPVVPSQGNLCYNAPPPTHHRRASLPSTLHHPHQHQHAHPHPIHHISSQHPNYIQAWHPTSSSHYQPPPDGGGGGPSSGSGSSAGSSDSGVYSYPPALVSSLASNQQGYMTGYSSTVVVGCGGSGEMAGSSSSPSTQSVLKFTSSARVTKQSLAPEKRPILACLFCRGRKIACGLAKPGTDDRTCNQCARRGLNCVYPTESRRGLKKKDKLARPIAIENTDKGASGGSRHRYSQSAGHPYARDHQASGNNSVGAGPSPTRA